MNQVLTLNDLKLIFTELHEVCDKWYGIGLELDLSVDYLEDLEANFSVDESTCLRKVLVEWLKSKQATWASLIKVLNSDIVKGSPLAKALQRKYSTGKGKKPIATDDNSLTTEASSSLNLRPSTCKGTKRVKKPPAIFTPKKPKVDVVTIPESFLPSDFANFPAPDRLCVKCSRVPKIPVVSKCCRRLYCEPCSTSMENTRCRKHKEVIEYIVDVDLRRKLSRLRRRCLNQSNGCRWKGDERELVQHLQNSCPQTSCPSITTHPEVSSTDDSATTSKVPSVVFTEPSPKDKKQVIVDENGAEGQESVERSTSEGNSDYKSVVSSSPQPLSMRQSKWTRESCYLIKTPPLNLAMENVSEYVDSDEAWLSDGFFSHQIGYKMCLAVRIESSSQVDGSLNVMMGITSAENTQNGYLSYPCSGFATVVILNPYKNCDHKVTELVFILEKPALNSYREIVSEVVHIPPHFITQDDCIFFRVEKIDMDKIKHKLWLLDASLVEDQPLQYEDGESS